jgi:hypothetical protein
MAAVPAAESPSAALIDIPYELLQDPDADLSSYIERVRPGCTDSRW